MKGLIIVVYILVLLATPFLALPGFLMAESAPQQAASVAPAVIAYVIARAVEKIASIG